MVRHREMKSARNVKEGEDGVRSNEREFTVIGRKRYSLKLWPLGRDREWGGIDWREVTFVYFVLTNKYGMVMNSWVFSN